MTGSRIDTSTTARKEASFTADEGPAGELSLKLSGYLDTEAAGRIWREVIDVVATRRPASLVVDAAGLEYCDGAGIALLLELKRRQLGEQRRFELRDLRASFQSLLDQFDVGKLTSERTQHPKHTNLFEETGRNTVKVLHDIYYLIDFIGELSAALVRAVIRPRSVRWKDAFLAADTAGVNSLPIIALVSFLIGMIMAFESATGLKEFGAEIYVANLVALAVLKELGPLMTAVLLAGRSGSGFAAELGTMKINEEMDALTTMGLDPVRFLVVTRTLALVVITPLLTICADFAGLAGGALVYCSFNFPLVTYIHQIQMYLHPKDLVSGVAKSFVFGLVVAAVGCLRGLQTTSGPSAVGEAATRAVVSGILLIVIIDGVFSMIYYVLGI
jgi:phospholipid/cholesterol/gamma-HCH transport system permease protein